MRPMMDLSQRDGYHFVLNYAQRLSVLGEYCYPCITWCCVAHLVQRTCCWSHDSKEEEPKAGIPPRLNEGSQETAGRVKLHPHRKACWVVRMECPGLETNAVSESAGSWEVNREVERDWVRRRGKQTGRGGNQTRRREEVVNRLGGGKAVMEVRDSVCVWAHM